MEQEILYTIEVKGGDEALQQAANLNKAIRANKTQIKELSKDYDKNAEEITKLNVENKKLTQEQRNLAKSAGAVAGSYDALSAEMSELKRQQKQVNVQTKEGQQKFASYGKQINGINTKLKKLDATNGVHTRNVGNYQMALQNATSQMNIMGVNVGQLSHQFTVAGQAMRATTGIIGGTSKSLRILRISLISTGVGAIVVALGSLIAYLTSTQEGLDKLNSVLRPVSAVFQRLLGVLQELGGKTFKKLSDAIKDPQQAFKDLGQVIIDNVLNRFKSFQVFMEAISLFMKGEFRQGLKKGADAIIQLNLGITDGTDKLQKFGKEIKTIGSEAIETGSKIDQLKKQIEFLEIDVARRAASLRRVFEEQKAITDDLNKSEVERLKAAKIAQDAFAQLTNLEISLRQKKLELLKAEQSLNDTSREELLENARLEAEIEQLRASAAKRTNEVANRQIQLQAALNKELTKTLNQLAGIEEETEDVGEAQIELAGNTVEAMGGVNLALDANYQKLLRNKKATDEFNQVAVNGLQQAKHFAQVYYQFQEAAMNAQLNKAGNDAKAREEITKRFAKKQQNIASVQAIIDGALGIVKTGSNLGYPQAIPFQILQGLQTAAQVALIRSQKFAKGGMLGGGVFEGKSHAQGGVKFAVGGRINEAEGGEAIINKRSTSMFKPILSAINTAGGGKKFEAGGITGNPAMNQVIKEVSGRSGGTRFVPVLQIPTTTDIQEDISVVEQNNTL